MKNKTFTRNNETKTITMGFDWLVMLFGFITLLFRKQWLQAAVLFAIAIIMNTILPGSALGVFIGYAFVSAGIREKEMLAAGWVEVVPATVVATTAPNAIMQPTAVPAVEHSVSKGWKD